MVCSAERFPVSHSTSHSLCDRVCVCSARYFIVAAGLGSTAVLSRVVVSGEQAERQKELAARRAEQLRELNTNSPM